MGPMYRGRLEIGPLSDGGFVQGALLERELLVGDF